MCLHSQKNSNSVRSYSSEKVGNQQPCVLFCERKRVVRFHSTKTKRGLFVTKFLDTPHKQTLTRQKKHTDGSRPANRRRRSPHRVDRTNDSRSESWRQSSENRAACVFDNASPR